MQVFRWTRHALEALAEREIERAEADRALDGPTPTMPGLGQRTIYLHMYHDRMLGQEMLLCIVTEALVDEVVIITVYKTSRIEKYLGGRTR